MLTPRAGVRSRVVHGASTGHGTCAPTVLVRGRTKSLTARHHTRAVTHRAIAPSCAVSHGSTAERDLCALRRGMRRARASDAHGADRTREPARLARVGRRLRQPHVRRGWRGRGMGRYVRASARARAAHGDDAHPRSAVQTVCARRRVWTCMPRNTWSACACAPARAADHCGAAVARLGASWGRARPERARYSSAGGRCSSEVARLGRRSSDAARASRALRATRAALSRRSQ